MTVFNCPQLTEGKKKGRRKNQNIFAALISLCMVIILIYTNITPAFAAGETLVCGEEEHTYTDGEETIDLTTAEAFEEYMAKLPTVKEILSTYYETRAEKKAEIEDEVKIAIAAYDVLSSEEQAKVKSETVSKLDTLEQYWLEYGYFTTSEDEQTVAVSKSSSDPAYVYQLIEKWHQISFQLDDKYDGPLDGPVTFVLVDGSKHSSWRANRADYDSGECNYEVTYCVDQMTSTRYGSYYKRINLEDADYYDNYRAAKIRAIVEKAHPYISGEQMVANMNAARSAAGLSTIDPLTVDDGQLVTATQLAVWNFANTAGAYSYAKTANWRPSSYKSHIDPIVEYNMDENEVANNIDIIYDYLVNLAPVYASNEDNNIAISNITYDAFKVAGDNGYDVEVKAELSAPVKAKDNITITILVNGEAAATYTQADIMEMVSQESTDGQEFIFNLNGLALTDTIEIKVSGTQYLNKGVYFYEPEYGRNSSQSMVGVSSGETPISANATITLDGVKVDFTKTTTISGLTLPVAGAEFELGIASANNVAGTFRTLVTGLTTDANGKISFEFLTNDANAQLAEGEAYYFKETKAPAGYQLTAGNEQYVKVDSADGTATMSNNGALELLLYKQNNFGVKLDGATFTLKLKEGKEVIAAKTTGKDGKISFGGLIPGTYILSETQAPTGYQSIDAMEIEVSAGSDGSTVVEFVNSDPNNVTVFGNVLTVTNNGKCNLNVHKIGDYEDVNLTGVSFKLYRDESGNRTKICDFTTDANGNVTFDLPPGTYILEETATLPGYNLLDEEIKFTIVEGQTITLDANAPDEVTEDDSTITIVNHIGVVLPETGGAGVTSLYKAGTLMILLSLFLLIYKRKIKKFHHRKGKMR